MSAAKRGPDGRARGDRPTANVKNLMLKEELVEAVRAGRFHVWAVSHIDEGIGTHRALRHDAPLPVG